MILAPNLYKYYLKVMFFTTVYAANYKTRVIPSFFKDVYSNRKGTYIGASQKKNCKSFISSDKFYVKQNPELIGCKT